MATDMRVGLKIEAQTRGDDKIAQLQRDVQELGRSADTASPEFSALAQEVQELARQAQAIDGFTRLKQASEQTAVKLAEMQQATRQAALALKEKQQASAAAASAEQAAAAQLAQAREQQAQMQATVKALKTEIQTLAKAAKDGGDSSAIMTSQLADSQAQLRVLEAAAKAGAVQVKDLAQAHQGNAAALKAAEREVGAAQRQFERLRQSTRAVGQGLQEQQQDVQRARDALSGMGLSAGALARSQQQVNQATKASEAALAALAQKAQDAAQVLANRELLGIKAHADVQKEIAKTRAAYEQLKASGTLSQAELAQASLKTEERIRQLKQQTSGWTQALGSAKAELAGLAASGAGLAVVAQQAIRFESAMADVAKVANASDAQMQQLTDKIKEMTRSIPLAAEELAAMAAAGAQLGVPLEKLEQFVLLSAQMATAFNMSADQAGEAVAKLSNVFALPLERVRDLGDAINTLGNNMAAKESAIVDVLTRIGGTAKQFGLTAEQAAALAASMLSLGVSAEVAGTGINAILSKLQTANIQSKDFQLALGSMGLSAEQLARDIRDNPQQAIDHFLQTLSGLDGARQAEVLAKLFGVEYQDDVARLVAGLDQYQKALDLVGDKTKTTGAMQQEFETRIKTTESELKLLKNAANEVAINLGSVFLPVIRGTASGLSDASNMVADFAQRFPTLSAAATTIAVVAVNVGTLTLAVKALRVAGVAAFPALATGAATSATAIGGLTLALRTAAMTVAKVWAAFEVGWAIGDKLRTEFVSVERAGIAMAAGLHKAAVMAQGAWEMLQAPFTDDTLDAAQQRMQQRLQELDDGYAELFAAAGQAKTAVDAQGQSAQASAQANTQAAQASGQAAAALQAQAQGAQASAQASAQAGQGAQLLVQEFAALKGSAQGVETAITQLASRLKFDDRTSITAFSGALQELAASGQLSAQQVGSAWQQALGQLHPGQLQAFRAEVVSAMADGALSAQQFAAINDQILANSFTQLGVNANLALNSIGPQAQGAIDHLTLLAQSFIATGANAALAQQGIELAMQAAIPKADSLAALTQLEQKLVDLNRAGLLSEAGILRTREALDKQRVALEDSLPGIQSVAEAMRRLGITSDAALKEAAKSAREAFEELEADGTSSARVMQQAFAKVAQAAIDANGGIADSWTRSRAAMHGYTLEVDSAGREVLVLKNILQDVGDTNARVTGRMVNDWGKVAQAAKEAQKQMGTDGKEVRDQVSAADAGGSFSAQAYAQQAKDVQELDAWWEEWSADYVRKNAKLGGTSISMSRYWFEVQKAQYENARRDLEMQERIQQSAAVRRSNAGAGAAGQPGGSGGGATYVSNITLPSGASKQVRFADSASQSAAEQLLRDLAQAKGVAS